MAANDGRVGLIIILSVGMLLGSFLVFFFFTAIVNFIIDTQLPLNEGSVTYDMWRKPPVTPIMRIYIYNVTNADEFLNDKQKPIINEIGPYTYSESWEKVNLVRNDNGTITFNQRKIFTFRPELSAGSEDDLVVVPNIPLLSATSKSASAPKFLRITINFMTNLKKLKPFVAVTVGELLWGYDDPLMQLAKEMAPDTKLPFERFGLFFDRNGTSADNITVYTGADDINKLGEVSRFNGLDKYSFYKTDECNSFGGSDGTIFPPHLNKNSKIYIFDKNLCRKLPFTFQKEVTSYDDIKAYRFSPPKNVFDEVSKNPENDCYCTAPPCAPQGTFNISACSFDTPVLLSFPHFYLGNPEIRNAVVGVSPPDPQKHEIYIDMKPEMGVPLRAVVRLQINLAVTHANDIDAVALFPDIIFPIMWFEDGIDRLPTDIVSLVKLATEVPTVARCFLLYILFFCGLFFLVVSVFCLIRSSNRQEIMVLPDSAFYGNKDDSTKKQKPPMTDFTAEKPIDTKDNPAFITDESK
ncbi:hypothetical protein V9T40_008320 [Parthenolecanium corni]|uniref:Scavenger receptor class B member 1 n=1 Tax=Parthenolecanium corni TaxID=536013 RepID=A0AAN9TKP0_9HEMI